MFLPDRLVVILTGVTTLLFQTHWIDDLGTDEGDVLGITVSAVGSVLLLSGLALRKRWSGRALLTLAFLSRTNSSTAAPERTAASLRARDAGSRSTCSVCDSCDGTSVKQKARPAAILCGKMACSPVV